MVSRPALVWRSASYFASIVSANVAIAAPNLAGKAGPLSAIAASAATAEKKEGCAEGAGSCTAFHCLRPGLPAVAVSTAKAGPTARTGRRARRLFDCPSPDLYDQASPAVKRMVRIYWQNPLLRFRLPLRHSQGILRDATMTAAHAWQGLGGTAGCTSRQSE